MRREPDFDESADMRLVELQRAALGISARPGHWESRVRVEGGAVEAEVVEPAASAVLAVDLTATPNEGLIPGAVVTVSLSIANEGVRPANGLLVAVPVPGNASFRSGSLLADGRPESDGYAEAFFGEGIRIAQLAPKSRATFVWKLGVRAGTSPLAIVPAIRADDAAIVGGNALAIERKNALHSAFGVELSRHEQPPATAAEPTELPFYELDEEEELEHIAGDAAVSGTDRSTAPAEPQAAAPAAEASAPPPTREAVALTGTIDRPSLSYFEQIFTGGKPVTLLHHFIFAGALACNRSYNTGAELGGLKRHLDAQSQLLHRITLHEKLGKKEPIAQYAGALEFDAATLVPERLAVPPSSSTAERLVLSTELDDTALAQLRILAENAARWDFVAARQFTLALQARAVVAEDHEDRVEAVNEALTAYARAAAAHLSRLFVRIRLDRTTGALFQKEPPLDEAARSALRALRALFEALD